MRSASTGFRYNMENRFLLNSKLQLLAFFFLIPILGFSQDWKLKKNEEGLPSSSSTTSGTWTATAHCSAHATVSISAHQIALL